MIELLIIFADKTERVLAIDTDMPYKLNGIELSGWTGINIELAKLNTEKPINKVCVPKEMPKNKVADVRKHVPKEIVLGETDELEYNGQTNTRDTRKRISELAPKASKELREEAYEKFVQITKLMDWMNKNVFTPHKPENATKAGKIHYHFPSPHFPETHKS